MSIRNCLLSVCSVLILSNVASADDVPAGLISELSGNDTANWGGLQPYGLNLGGWAAGGINYNTANPSDRSNGPVSMTDRAGEFHLYQLNLFIEKAVVKDTT